MKHYLPIALVVLSNTFYHICAKSTPERVNPFASLTVTYLVGAAVSVLLYAATQRQTANLLSELRGLNWSNYVLGISIVGLEAGFLYMYKLGWNISAGQIVSSVVLAIVLIFVGFLFYREPITTDKVIGIAICLVGLYFINK